MCNWYVSNGKVCGDLRKGGKQVEFICDAVLMDYKESDGIKYAKLYVGGEVELVEHPERKDVLVPVYKEGKPIVVEFVNMDSYKPLLKKTKRG